MQPPLWHDESAAHVRPTDAVVHWVCERVAHREAPSRGGRGGLTVYRGRWAYCDGMVDDDRHEWTATGGVPIDRLVDWAKALDPLRGHTVRR
ncbi:MAG: hypothetical protein KGK34_05185 [Chloroflexota bacterium]|nr:hypothetical protein [Chloroflexota bacterium]